MSDQEIAVKCPECGHEFPLSEAVLSSVKSSLANKLQSEIRKREQEASEKLRLVEERTLELKKQEEQMQGTVSELVDASLRKEREEIRLKAEKKAAADQEVAMASLQEEIAIKIAALKKAQQDEITLRREKREVEEARESLKLEVQRTLDEERSKLKESAKAQADEENRLKISEKERVITDLIQKLEEAQRKAEQGSQQLQGEVLEADFENQLRRAFFGDTITEVSKGVKGADLSHEVFSKGGNRCGLILYENKRTKNWSDGWVTKLKEDMRRVNADIGVIVTEAMPPSSECFCQRDEIWVTDLKSAVPLAHVLRCILQEVTTARAYREGAKEKMEQLYTYLTGNEFRHRVSAVIEAFVMMRGDLEKERRSLTKAWSKREKQINSVVENMAGLIGDVQGISGNALQEIPSLELDSDPADELDAALADTE